MNFYIKRLLDGSDLVAYFLYKGYFMANKIIFTEEQEQEIIEFYLEPNTLKNTVNRFNLSAPVIKRILKKYNILLHSKEIITNFKFNGKRANQLISKEKEKNIINFYLIPNTLKDTANKFNTCSQTVRAILIKNNIALHSKEINIQLRQQKEIESNLQKYGVENTFQRSDIKEKIKQTNLQNYGVDNISKANYIKEKKKQTFNKKYGVDNCSQLDTIKKKKEKTCMEHFGVPCYLQTDDCREKLKQINFEKYGMYHTPKLLYKYENQYFDSFPELCLYIYYIKKATPKLLESL